MLQKNIFVERKDMVNKEIIENGFFKIEKKLNEEFIGQKTFNKELCDYFKEKIEEDSKGILLIVEERDIFKNSVLKYFFEELNYYKFVKNSKIDEIDLAAYKFNLVYNAFLTDLYEKLNNDSQCLVFKNTDKAGVHHLVAEIEQYSCPVEESVKQSLDYLLEAPFVKASYSK